MRTTGSQSHGRPPSAVGIEVKVTDRCNQRCSHCANMDGGKAGLDLDIGLFAGRLRDWGERRTESAWDIREVRMTGGEPLLRVAGVLEIARCCALLGIRCGVNTNATLLTPGAAAELKAAGMTVFKASLDSLDEEMFGRLRGPGASLEQSLRGLRLAVEAGFEVIARYTLCRANRGQLLSCYDHARALGAARFQVKPLVAAGRARGSDEFLNPDEIRLALKELAGAVNGSRTVPEILCWPPDRACGLPGTACGSVNKIYVSARGEVCDCNFIAPARRFGDLASESFERILERRAAAPAIRRRDGHAVLAGCPVYTTSCSEPAAMSGG